jgi:hypothetical protein
MVSWRKPLSGQMSEQQGKVIDGTARASHWRRSSPSSTPDAELSSGHSEAPKNIASSLLVPAHMLLDGTSAGGEGPGEHPTGLVAQAPGAAEDLYVNIFLAADRASNLADRPREASLPRRAQAVVRRSAGRVVGRLPGSAESRRWWPIVIRTRTAARPITIAVAMLGVLAALIILSAVLGPSGAPERQGQSVGPAKSLETLKPNVLSASADPLGTSSAAHRPATRVRPPHSANTQHPKKHATAAPRSTPVRTSRNQGVVMAHYTPTTTTPSSTGSTSDTQSASNTASTPTASAPAAPRHYTSSPNSGSGSGSSSKSPSKATLRSLVTGAGQCSCQ